ncbi:helix-turn-helix transcriptional regulator [Mesorhizobium sp. Z1-4]|uniref:helix-turn-helix domain-containing protein n=1 Tax=Mesorhizobium sp. Z1-4 TaxID=2448478 RepID=UPI000FDABBBC|nr:helix-turn-helix transcriptional regulator [Mesorhizobium sp. Z1-4]
MKNQSIALDLRAWRRKAGLLQADVAHLLGIERARICDMEKGRLLPTADQLVALSLIYGKSLDALLAGFLDETVDSLVERLQRLPAAASTGEKPGFNRAHRLSDLSRRLEMVANRTV